MLQAQSALLGRNRLLDARLRRCPESWRLLGSTLRLPVSGRLWPETDSGRNSTRESLPPDECSYLREPANLLQHCPGYPPGCRELVARTGTAYHVHVQRCLARLKCHQRCNLEPSPSLCYIAVRSLAKRCYMYSVEVCSQVSICLSSSEDGELIREGNTMLS